MQDRIETRGHFATQNAAKYLAQLCKHFGHKVPSEVSEDGRRGDVRFAMGEAELSADEVGLTAILRGADRDAVDRMRPIIDDHLKRFAFREDFVAMTWVD